MTCDELNPKAKQLAEREIYDKLKDTSVYKSISKSVMANDVRSL